MTTLTLAEAAARLGVSRTAVVKMIATGKLTFGWGHREYTINRKETRLVKVVLESDIERIRRER